MKYRKIKKRNRQTIINNIERLSIRPDDIVVFKYERGKTTAREMHELFTYIRKYVVKKNNMVAIPNTVSLLSMNTDEIKRIRDLLDEEINSRNDNCVG